MIKNLLHIGEFLIIKERIYLILPESTSKYLTSNKLDCNHILEEGTKILYLGIEQGYYKVLYKNMIRYTHRDYIEVYRK